MKNMIKRIISRRIPFLWCYAKGNVMVGHRFSDDVALCLALSRKGAVKKINRLYKGVQPDEIFPVYLNSQGVSVLTDY